MGNEAMPVWPAELTEFEKAIDQASDPLDVLRPVSTHRRCIVCGSPDVFFLRCPTCERIVQAEARGYRT